MSSYDFPEFDARNPLDFGMRVVVPQSVAEQIEDTGILHINERGEPEIIEAESVRVTAATKKSAEDLLQQLGEQSRAGEQRVFRAQLGAGTVATKSYSADPDH